MSTLETLGELGGLSIGFLLTVFVFSYVYKDNPLYRLAVHILVGVSAAYAVVIVTRELFLPILETMRQESAFLSLMPWVLPILLALLMILKAVPSVAWLGNSSMAVIFAVGAAVGLTGAVAGTLIPQVTAGYASGVLTLLVAGLSICVLLYFHFTGWPTDSGQQAFLVGQKYIGGVGRAVITITLAALFAGLFSTSLVLLTERVGFFIESFSRIIDTLGS